MSGRLRQYSRLSGPIGDFETEYRKRQMALEAALLSGLPITSCPE